MNDKQQHMEWMDKMIARETLKDELEDILDHLEDTRLDLLGFRNQVNLVIRSTERNINYLKEILK